MQVYSNTLFTTSNGPSDEEDSVAVEDAKTSVDNGTATMQLPCHPNLRD